MFDNPFDFGPPYPLEPEEFVDPQGNIVTVESTFDKDGITRQLRDEQGRVLKEQTIPPIKAD